MKKKGYMLVETLIVSVTITSILIYLYAQFTNVQTFYNEVNKFNNVNELYLTGTVKDLIIYNNEDILKKVDSGNVINVCNLNNCNVTPDINSVALYDLISHYGIKNIIIAKANKSNEIKNYINGKNFSPLMKSFSNAIADQDSKYRIIVEYNDEQIATVLFGS